MNEFSAEWLALREAADRQARSPQVLSATWVWAGQRATTGDPLRVLDLGAGTGANLRFLAPRLPPPQTWTLVEYDKGLLSMVRCAPGGQVSAMLSGGALRVQALVRDLAAVRSTGNILARADLITASALFDLVSEVWCQRLLREIARPGAALLAALTYNGRLMLDPPHAYDSTVRVLFNRDQLRDKGFGPALGPAAGRTLVRLASAAGARVIVARSDWRLGSNETVLLRHLVRGWAAAARGVQRGRARDIDSWLELREVQADARLLTAIVGHLDVLAIWPASSGASLPKHVGTPMACRSSYRRAPIRAPVA